MSAITSKASVDLRVGRALIGMALIRNLLRAPAQSSLRGTTRKLNFSEIDSSVRFRANRVGLLHRRLPRRARGHPRLAPHLSLTRDTSPQLRRRNHNEHITLTQTTAP